jgi:hypothetical protein
LHQAVMGQLGKFFDADPFSGGQQPVA